jgi:hypothetical protein
MRYGYRRIVALLLREGWPEVNRVLRLYKLAACNGGLNPVSTGHSRSSAPTAGMNQVWADGLDAG